MSQPGALRSASSESLYSQNSVPQSIGQSSRLRSSARKNPTDTVRQPTANPSRRSSVSRQHAQTTRIASPAPHAPACPDSRSSRLSHRHTTSAGEVTPTPPPTLFLHRPVKRTGLAGSPPLALTLHGSSADLQNALLAVDVDSRSTLNNLRDRIFSSRRIVHSRSAVADPRDPKGTTPPPLCAADVMSCPWMTAMKGGAGGTQYTALINATKPKARSARGTRPQPVLKRTLAERGARQEQGRVSSPCFLHLDTAQARATLIDAARSSLGSC
ncbi:hypothetical protein C8R44DRAFT_864490 [Mycena epipterygia]|nr:hypothetical protein C8R44DRAFT_864490 [Mycena epipterygia]